MPSVQKCEHCGMVVTTDTPRKTCSGCGKPMRNRPTDRLVDKTIAGCRLIKRIGMGATAVVYEAEQVSDHKKVAVKMLTAEAAKDPENGVRFVREAELCQRLHHPNIVDVHRFGCENNIHFMIMELVDGASMETVIEKHGIMEWRKVVELILQVAQALDNMSQKGVIHRDIKPANILLTKDGIAKVLDLGFAKKIGSDSSERLEAEGELTMQGVTMGSPAYMPPEQVLDAKSADGTADVYSLGATFFHALTGQTPFNGKTAYEIMDKVIREPAPSVRSMNPNVPKAIDLLVQWSMEKNPDHRPQSAAEFIRELETAIYAPDDSKRIKKLRSQQKGQVMTFIIIGAVVLVVGIIIAAIIFWP